MEKKTADRGVPSVNIPQTQPADARTLKQSAPYRTPPVIPPALPMTEPLPAPTCNGVGEAREKQIWGDVNILPKPSMPGAQYLPNVPAVPVSSGRESETGNHTFSVQLQPNPQGVSTAPSTGRKVCNYGWIGGPATKSGTSGETLRQRPGPYAKKVQYPSRSHQRRPAKQHSWTVLTASSTSTSAHQLSASRDSSEGSSSTPADGLGWLSGGLAQALFQRGNARRERSSTDILKDLVPYQWLLQRLKKAAATETIENDKSDSTPNYAGKSDTFLPNDEQQPKHLTSSSMGQCAYQTYSHSARKTTSETSIDSYTRALETESGQPQDETMELDVETSSEMETETANSGENRPDGIFMENTAFDRLLFDHKSKSLGGVADNRLRCPAVEDMETEWYTSTMAEQACAGTVRQDEGKGTEGCGKRDDGRRRRFLSGPARLLVDRCTSFTKVMAATTERMRGRRLMEEDILKRKQPRGQLPKVPAKRRWKSF
ncbi:Hypp7420 [Branchiostoma lanceolatum]|uniref:Hypp7420 protein n=1 Tax=Branchiostoma lanceolatum TaxID=7740 RepID=A0A8J9Z034_BRALA|nr:Hypp7420 [Branchiostoma lanceolatum]